MLLALMKKELLALSRDLHGMAALFLMPMVFIIVMSMALKDVYAPTTAHLTYAVLDQDQGKAAQELVARWQKERGAAQALPGDWRSEVRAGRLKYVLLIEHGFSSAVAEVGGTGHARARLFAEPGLDNGMFETHRVRLLAMVTQLRAEALLANLPDKIDLGELMGEVPAAAERMTSGARPSAVQQNVPAWLVFGMFFVVASIAGLFVEERSCGALARLRSLGVAPWQLILGKMLPYLWVNGIQAALMLAVGIWLMPLLGGDGLSLHGVHWGALVLMLLAISLAAVSLALAVASLVTTHAQAATLGPILNVLMAALGGIMVPLFVMPSVMQRIAAYSPMNWGLEGLLDVLLRGADVVGILPEVGRLCGFAAIMLVAAFALFRRQS